MPFASLRHGDKVDVQTQNSHYQFEIYFDPKTGNQGIKETSAEGKLAGTSGIPAIYNSIKTGQAVVYVEENGSKVWHTSKVVDFTIHRNPTNALNPAIMTPEERLNFEKIRRQMGGDK